MIIAKFISLIANPIFILISLPYFLVIKSTRNTELAIYWTLYTWIFLSIFVAYVLFGIKKKFFTDIDISERRERPMLYLTGAILAFIYLIGLFIFHAPSVLFITIIGIMSGIFFGSLINLKVKASVHVTAISALITALSLVYQGYYILLFLLIPVVCWARIKVKRHTLTEVIIGAIFGTLLSLIMFINARNILDL